MQLSQQDLLTLTQKAIFAAEQAGKEINNSTKSNLNISFKTSNTSLENTPTGGNSIASQIVTEVDIKSQNVILDILTPTLSLYDLGLLTEEQCDDKSRFEKDFFWCIDPLDGTLPFTEGKEGYSVSIALVSRTGMPYVGVVHNPVNSNTYWAYKNGGAFKNQKPWQISKSTNHFSFIMDGSFAKSELFKNVHAEIEKYAHSKNLNDIKLINQGGAAMNAIWVIENNPGCYFKIPKKEQGGGSLWDFAATSAIFNELNIPATDIFGNTLDLNKKHSTFMNLNGVLYASNLEIASFIQNINNILLEKGKGRRQNGKMY